MSRDLVHLKHSAPNQKESLNMSLRNIGNKRSNGKWDLLVVLADCSGSMDGSIETSKKFVTKIEAMRDALVNMVKSGNDDSQILLIPFPGRDLYRAAEYAPTNTTSLLLAYINGCDADGATPMGEALASAYHKTQDRNPRFILLSDGQPTDFSKEDILELVKSNRVTIDVVGVGDKNSPGSYDPVFLKEIADATGGIYSEVENHEAFVKTMYELSPIKRNQITDGSDKSPIAL